MICTNCGAENRDTAKFCHRCAAPLNIAESQSSPNIAMPVLTPNVDIEQRVQSAAPIKPANATSEPVNAEPVLPLVAGVKLVDRYTIVEILSTNADKTIYRARDEWRCPDPTCGAENPPGETFCQNCGRELTDHPMCRLEESAVPQDPASVAPPDFISGNRLYRVQAEPASVTVPPKPFPNGVRLNYAMKSDIGLVRGADAESKDEDSVFALSLMAMYESVAQPTIGVFFVADGIGGATAGEVASKLCAQTLVPELIAKIIAPIFAGTDLDDMAVRGVLEESIQKTNTMILQAAKDKGNDMGTTLTLALVIDAKAYVASVGDSRTYLFDAGKLKQISHDHSLVAKLVELGQIKPNEIYTHPERNKIIRSLGASSELEVDLFPADGGAFELKPGMRWLLCCDGLWEMVRDDELEEELLREVDPQKLCDKLIARANQAGGDDNISLVVVNIEA